MTYANAAVLDRVAGYLPRAHGDEAEQRSCMFRARIDDAVDVVRPPYLGLPDSLSLPSKFLWNPAPAAMARRADNSDVIVCVELPHEQPLAAFQAYVDARVLSHHIIFVGDIGSIDDDDYYELEASGALLRHAPAPHWRISDLRSRVERELAAFFAAEEAVVRPRYVVRNPYRYKSAPEKVTSAELAALLLTIGRVERR